MKMASLKLFAILIGLGFVSTFAHNSHYGTSFDLGMTSMYVYDPNITLDVASKTSGHIGLYIPYLNINRTQSLNNGHTSIKVENQIIRRGYYRERRGIHILTDIPVAVYVTLYVSAITESYLALPNTFTGKSYIVGAFEPYSGQLSETLIVGSDISTSVNITKPRQSTSSVSLNWLDVNQVASLIDVTGTVISADGRVSVISGTACANVPHSYTHDCGFIVEQMIPTDAWETEYIVPNMPPRTGVLIRVVSHKSHDVCFYTKRGASCKQIPHPYSLQFSTGPEPVVVRSNSTISVMSYGIGGGPFMITVPGIKNFMNEYYFIVPPSYRSFSNSIAVVIQSSRLTGLLLDGSPIEPSQSYNVPQPYENYRVLISSITSGYHTLSHQDMSVTFGAFLYGHGRDEGYGFPLGMQKETVSATTKAKVKTTLDSDICYYCDNMFHVELCDVVQRCSGSEICYLERFLKHGRQTFRSGCLSQEICSREYESASTEPDRCIECCFGSYCNNKGCGETGLPARDLRGPLCYDCEYTLSPDECDTLKLCDEGQVCRIEETKWGTNSNYLMGCARASCSPVKRSVHVSARSARSTRICQSCCSEDYCNLNCTVGTGHEQPDIVG